MPPPTVDPRSFLPALRRAFPRHRFRDPLDRRYGKDWSRNLILVAAAPSGLPAVYVWRGGRTGPLWDPPVRPPRVATRSSIRLYVTLMVDLYADLGLRPCPEHLTDWLVRPGYPNHAKAAAWVRAFLKQLLPKRNRC